jgi:hypothetical protein
MSDAVIQNRLYSTDGITWINVFSGTSSAVTALAYGNGLYLAGLATTALLTSTDGITWTPRTSGVPTAQMNSLAYGAGVYVGVGAGGFIVTSTDAITWTSRTSGTASPLLQVIYGNGFFVAGGDGGVLRTSTDGITWTVRQSGLTAVNTNISGLTYTTGLYVYIAAAYVGTSTDSLTLKSSTYDTTTQFFIPALSGLVTPAVIAGTPTPSQATMTFYVKAGM